MTAGATGRGVRIAAALVVAGALLSGPLAMLVVSQVAPQPPWTSVAVFADRYHPVQALPYALGYLLLVGFVLFTAACHAASVPSLRMRTTAAIVFTGVYATLVFTNYTIQLAFIPRVLHDRRAYLAELTMANPVSFAWFLEMFGYAAMGVATALVAPAFSGTRRADVIRVLLVANGLLSVVGAACTAMFDAWVFSTAGLLSFVSWNLLVVVCFGLIAVTPDGGMRR